MAPSSSVARLSGREPSPVALRPSLATGLPMSEESGPFHGQDAGHIGNVELIGTCGDALGQRLVDLYPRVSLCRRCGGMRWRPEK